MTDKKILRKQLSEKRQEIDRDQVVELSNQIDERLIGWLDWDNIKTLHVYESMVNQNEVITSRIIDFAKSKNIELITPEKNIPINKNFDVVIVPLLGFDNNGNRLGFGGGYYDKFLAKNNAELKVGLAYSVQEQESIPTEPHDIKLDIVVTEKEIFDFRK